MSKSFLQCTSAQKTNRKGGEGGNRGAKGAGSSLTTNAVLWTPNGEEAGSGKSVFPLSFRRKGYLITFRNGPWLVEPALWWIEASTDSLLSSSSSARRGKRGRKSQRVGGYIHFFLRFPMATEYATNEQWVCASAYMWENKRSTQWLSPQAVQATT